MEENKVVSSTEVVDTEKQKTTEDAGSKNKKPVVNAAKDLKPADNAGSAKVKTAKSVSRIEEIINMIAKEMRGYGRNADGEMIESLTKDVLATVFNMCSLDEYAIGTKVDGEVYRYSDYIGPSTLQRLLVAKKVVASDVISAVDFLDHNAYKTERPTLAPANFASKCKQLSVKLRINPELHELSRPSVELLGSATQFAVNGKKVVDRNNDHILFLVRNFDDEARDSLQEWCKAFALRYVTK